MFFVYSPERFQWTAHSKTEHISVAKKKKNEIKEEME